MEEIVIDGIFDVEQEIEVTWDQETEIAGVFDVEQEIEVTFDP